MAKAVKHINQFKQGRTIWMRSRTWQGTDLVNVPEPIMILERPELEESQTSTGNRYKVRARGRDGDTKITLLVNPYTGRLVMEHYLFTSRAACEQFCRTRPGKTLKQVQQELHRLVGKLERNGMFGAKPVALYQPGLAVKVTETAQQALHEHFESIRELAKDKSAPVIVIDSYQPGLGGADKDPETKQ